MAVADVLASDPKDEADDPEKAEAEGGKKGEKPAHFGKGAAPADDDKKKHKDNMIIIIISLVGLVLTYLIFKSKGSTAATTNTSPPVSGTVAGGGVGSDPAAQQAISGLGSQFTAFGQQYQTNQTAQANAMQGFSTMLANLGDKVTALEAVPPTGTPQTPGAYTAPTGEVLTGSGYGGQASVTDRAGSIFDYVSTPAQALGIQGAGGQLYFQPTPGQFVPSTYGPKGSTAPGTPTYTKVA